MDCRASNLQPYQPSFMAENGDIWLGTWDKGLWVIDSRDIDRAIQTGQVRADNSNIRSSTGNCPVFRIVEDRDEHLWISSNRGCFEYIPPTGISKSGQWSTIPTTEMIPIRYAPISRRTSTPIPSPNNKTIWIGPARGLNRIVFDADGKANLPANRTRRYERP